jgi:hypothetical protein
MLLSGPSSSALSAAGCARTLSSSWLCCSYQRSWKKKCSQLLDGALAQHAAEDALLNALAQKVRVRQVWDGRICCTHQLTAAGVRSRGRSV